MNCYSEQTRSKSKRAHVSGTDVRGERDPVVLTTVELLRVEPHAQLLAVAHRQTERVRLGRLPPQQPVQRVRDLCDLTQGTVRTGKTCKLRTRCHYLYMYM